MLLSPQRKPADVFWSIALAVFAYVKMEPAPFLVVYPDDHKYSRISSTTCKIAVKDMISSG